jgi:hypothetical protein
MADTGAPWNIPYAEPTDLVRDWPALSEDVADAVADGLDAVLAGGIGSNVVQTVKTDVFSTTSATFTAVTGLAVTITPTSNTSKVLLLASVMLSSTADSTNDGAYFRITGGNTSGFVGDANGSARRSIGGFRLSTGGNSNHFGMAGYSAVLLDSPATDTATTYQVEAVRAAAGTMFVNRAGSDGTGDVNGRGISSIIAIEVAA